MVDCIHVLDHKILGVNACIVEYVITDGKVGVGAEYIVRLWLFVSEKNVCLKTLGDFSRTLEPYTGGQYLAHPELKTRIGNSLVLQYVALGNVSWQDTGRRHPLGQKHWRSAVDQRRNALGQSRTGCGTSQKLGKQ